ncbi:hypothetical protein JX266_008546 [Neoarthrinium moseri]|uniref:uncharacterized protein n=1 Tax=Neoarthrinium moseri TaxID=1658444 RepID=UPI001FDD3DB5|nr:uncharacterized protein JN550_009388 [Neoarthrinium moseri]KAI1845236.1 hypothetical protein JX266_008546 [Neoarthrinium moseri]KAI1863890.1 hypothetical protein JN550_009388 [Neoarthrinium moseri]
MNPYPAPVAHHPPPQQHGLPPDAAAPPPSHYHHGLPPAHEQSHQLPPALPHQHQHQPYYPDPRVPPMAPPRADHLGHPPLPGIRDHAPEVGQRENGNGATTLKGEADTERPPEHPPPPSVEKDDDTRRYKLVCEQQPQRARMCGFGDKDRRPITPPPCIRLIVIDKATGKEVDCNQIEHQMYVLAVDLWNAEGTKEYNLVKHSTNSPSISSTTSTSFRELESSGPGPYPQQHYPVHMPPRETGPYAAPPTPHGMPYPPPVPGYSQEYSQGQYGSYNGQPVGYGDFHFRHQMPHNVPQLPSQTGYGGRYPQDVRAAQQPNGMYTRNLIGNLVSSAARLTDPNDKIGIWFVLQDLSVRTEGWFRVGVPNTTGDTQTSDPQKPNTGKTPILAQCFSEPFQVYSAKKFPGVCESTALSKCFAHQGIKIPIRKEGPEGKSKNKGSDDDDEF